MKYIFNLSCSRPYNLRFCQIALTGPCVRVCARALYIILCRAVGVTSPLTIFFCLIHHRLYMICKTCTSGSVVSRQKGIRRHRTPHLIPQHNTHTHTQFRERGDTRPRRVPAAQLSYPHETFLCVIVVLGSVSANQNERCTDFLLCKQDPPAQQPTIQINLKVHKSFRYAVVFSTNSISLSLGQIHLHTIY